MLKESTYPLLPHIRLQACGIGLAQGAAPMAYSPRLLSGLLRCGPCGARMVAHVTTRRKLASVYRYGSYRCSFATHKGPAVCTHSTGYRQERLEAALLAKFREAMTPRIVDALTQAINAQIESAFRHFNGRSAGIKAEVLRLEREAGHRPCLGPPSP